MTSQASSVGVAMVGYAFMGAVHSQAWMTAPRVFDLTSEPEPRVLVGRDRAGVTRAAAHLGWPEAETNWRTVLMRDDIGIVDICTPSDTHAEIAIAALEAGKHVLCEKPLANSVEEAEMMAASARRAATLSQRTMVGFNYRRVPALQVARNMICDGQLGDIRQVRAAYRQDWLVDPSAPLSWRMQRERAGSGALGDIGSHAVDLAQFLLGQPLVAVTALLDTFVRERPLPDGGSGIVDVDDCAMFAGHFTSGAVASFEATRVATGRKNALEIEVSGSHGALAFNLEALNELRYYDGRDRPAEAGFRRILITEPDHPYMSAWWPPGHIIGWEHTFTHQIADFVASLRATQQPSPSFQDGLQVQRVLAAVERSANEDSRLVTVDVPTSDLSR